MADSPAESTNFYETSDGMRMSRETNDKMVVDSTFQRVTEGHDKTLRHAEESHRHIMEQNDQLFSQMMREREQLFALNMGILSRTAHNGVSNDVQTTITNPMEVSEATIAAKNAFDADNDIARTIEAALANLSEQNRSSSMFDLEALKAAVTGAVLDALENKPE